MINYYENKFNNMESFLNFKSNADSLSNYKTTIGDKQAQKAISTLYSKMVPSYLKEDHPTEFPENAKNLVKKVG